MLRRYLALGLMTALAAAAPALAQTERKNLAVFTDVAKTVQQYSNFTIFDDVAANVSEGTVVLTGKVTMPYKRSAIEKRVAKIDGVQTVVNNITTLPTSPFDDELRYQVARAIYGHSSFWHYAAMANPPIHIVVENGHVKLTGVVNNNVERMLARSLATSFGAFSVKSELKTDAEVKADLEKLGNH
jgi:hyperosmotically inducible periplasmic protein